jgi:hypothetical protein
MNYHAGRRLLPRKPETDGRIQFECHAILQLNERNTRQRLLVKGILVIYSHLKLQCFFLNIIIDFE